jgi:hypothetical protein
MEESLLAGSDEKKQDGMFKWINADDSSDASGPCYVS